MTVNLASYSCWLTRKAIAVVYENCLRLEQIITQSECRRTVKFWQNNLATTDARLTSDVVETRWSSASDALQNMPRVIAVTSINKNTQSNSGLSAKAL
jgi:hypothetical protein